MQKDNNDNIKIKWSRLIIVGLISLALMFLVYVLGIKEVGHDGYTALLEWINSHFSLRLGVFLYAYIVDTLILPLSPDLVWIVGAGMVSFEAIFFAGLGSALGGISSYGIGMLVDKVPFVKKLTDSANRKWGSYIKAYGVPLVALSAIFPLPFSTLCTVAGIVGLDFKKIAISSSLRFIHAALYFLLFRAGLLLI